VTIQEASEDLQIGGILFTSPCLPWFLVNHRWFKKSKKMKVSFLRLRIFFIGLSTLLLNINLSNLSSSWGLFWIMLFSIYKGIGMVKPNLKIRSSTRLSSYLGSKKSRKRSTTLKKRFKLSRIKLKSIIIPSPITRRQSKNWSRRKKLSWQMIKS